MFKHCNVNTQNRSVAPFSMSVRLTSIFLYMQLFYASTLQNGVSKGKFPLPIVASGISFGGITFYSSY